MERVQRAAQSAARSAFASAVSSKPGPKTLFVERALYDYRTSSALCLRSFADAAFLNEHGVKDVIPFPSQQAEKRLHPNEKPRAAVFLLRGISARGAHDLVRLLDTRRRGKEHPPLHGVVLVTPRASQIIEKILSRSGVPRLSVRPLPLGFLPYDADVLSLDWPSAYREFVLGGDPSAIRGSAHALVSLADTLRLSYAPIRSAGPAAGAVAEEILETHGRRYAKTGSRRVNGFNSAMSVPGASPRPPLSVISPARSDIPDDVSVVDSEYFALSDTSSALTSKDGVPRQSPTYGQTKRKRTPVNLVLLDRGVDIVSTLLTQWTYEGLLDESLGLGNNMIVCPVTELQTDDARVIFKVPDNPGGGAIQLMRLSLRADSDSLFKEVRDMSYWAASGRIGSVASGVQKYYSERPERETAEIGKVRDYVLGLKAKKSDHQRASEHLALAAEISARTFYHLPFKRRFEFERELLDGGSATVRDVFVGDTIARGESLEHVLRLACLWSVTSNGIPDAVLDFLRREIIATFGLDALPMLANLERAGLLVHNAHRDSQGPWLQLPGLGRGGGGGGGNAGASVDEKKKKADEDASDTQSVQSYRTNSSAPPARSNSAPPAARPRIATHSWHFARAALRLVENFDPEKESKKKDAALSASAPFLGYTPLSVRLMEAALSKDGWAALPPSPPHKALLPLGHAAVEHRAAPAEGAGSKGALPFDSVVLFVGGVMRAEISAIRLAAKAAGKKVLVLTTHVVSSNEFIASFGEGST